MKAVATGAAITVVILGIATMQQSWLLGLRVHDNAGPGFLPFWSGFAVACLGLVECVRTVRSADTTTPFWDQNSEYWPILFLFGALIVFVLLFDTIGFITTTFLFVLAVMTVWGRYGIVSSTIAAVATAATIRIVLMGWLQMPLPRGVLGL
jgi:hypothetical protein